MSILLPKINQIEQWQFVGAATLGGIAISAISFSDIVVPLAAACIPPLASRIYNHIQNQSVQNPAILTPQVPITEIADLAKHRKSEFCRRIPDGEWGDIIQKITELNHRVSPEELEALRLGKWNHRIFRQKDWIYLAFQAYLEDRLNLDTMCKLFLYDECKKQTLIDSYSPQEASKRMQSYQLFDKNGSGCI